MATNPQIILKNISQKLAVKVILVYLFFGVMWIYIPMLVTSIESDIEQNYNMIAFLKDSLFLAFSGALIYWLIERNLLYLKLAQSDYDESQKKLEAIVNTVIDGLIIIDDKGNIEFANPSTQVIFGFQNQELIGKNVKMLMPEPYQSEHDQYLENYIESNVKKIIGIGREVKGQHKNGKIFPLDLAVSEFYFRGQRKFVGMTRDITERWVHQQAMNKEHSFIDAVIETIGALVVVLDAEGRIIRFNRFCEHLTGYTFNEVKNKTVWEVFITNSQLTEVKQVFKTLITDKQSNTHENIWKIKNGSLRIISWSNTIIRNEEDEVDYVIATGIDVTEETKAKQELLDEREILEIRVNERTAELTQANEELKNFSYIVSHDLRSPLVNIRGFSGELKHAFEIIFKELKKHYAKIDLETLNTLHELIEVEIPESFRYIDTSVTKMNDLTNAILKLSRLGRRTLTLERVDTKSLIMGILDTLAYNIEQAKIEINLGEMPIIIADRTSLEQIFSNLLSNAVKYTEDGRAGKVEMWADADAEKTTFYVKDNGRGIAQSEMEKIFELFRRVGKQNVPGEGMGLTYVRAIVRRHGGEIWCNSNLGHGTTFIFSIPHNTSEHLDY